MTFDFTLNRDETHCRQTYKVKLMFLPLLHYCWQVWICLHEKEILIIFIKIQEQIRFNICPKVKNMKAGSGKHGCYWNKIRLYIVFCLEVKDKFDRWLFFCTLPTITLSCPLLPATPCPLSVSVTLLISIHRRFFQKLLLSYMENNFETDNSWLLYHMRGGGEWTTFLYICTMEKNWCGCVISRLAH